jgi:deoxyribonuclease-1
MRFLLLLSLSFSSLLFASIHEKMGQQYSYYGRDFYVRSAKAISKEVIFDILTAQHLSRPKDFDQIGPKCSGQNCYSQLSIGYSQARKVLFGELYKQQDYEGTFVEDVYCGKKFYFRSLDQVSNMGSQVNIEHTWPQSKFNSSFDKELQKSDLHHLFLTDSLANNRRANHRFGETGGRHNELNVHDCDDSKLAEMDGEMVFTPPVEHRGNVARALFYFSVRYQLPIKNSEEKILKKWHAEDPVSDEEEERHEIIARYQNVRNPFIDHPEIVDQIQDF